MVSSKLIRLLVVDADPGEGQALPARLHEVEGIEVVGVARSGRAAIQLAETTQPDVLLVDLMLPEYRSIQAMEQIAGTQPQVCHHQLHATVAGLPLSLERLYNLMRSSRVRLCKM